MYPGLIIVAVRPRELWPDAVPLVPLELYQPHLQLKWFWCLCRDDSAIEDTSYKSVQVLYLRRLLLTL